MGGGLASLCLVSALQGLQLPCSNSLQLLELDKHEPQDRWLDCYLSYLIAVNISFHDLNDILNIKT